MEPFHEIYGANLIMYSKLAAQAGTVQANVYALHIFSYIISDIYVCDNYLPLNTCIPLSFSVKDDIVAFFTKNKTKSNVRTKIMQYSSSPKKILRRKWQLYFSFCNHVRRQRQKEMNQSRSTIWDDDISCTSGGLSGHG